MAFKKKTWVDRLVEYAGRRKITNVTTMAAQIVDVERAEGVVSEEGTAINAVNMNDLEQRTADAFSAVQQDIEGINSDLGGMKWKKLGDYTGNAAIDISACAADEYEVMIYSSAIPGTKLNIHLNKQQLGNTLYTGFIYNDENYGSTRIETTVNSLKIGHLNINSNVSMAASNWRISVYYK